MMTCCGLGNAVCFMKCLAHRATPGHLSMRRLEVQSGRPPPTDPTVFERFGRITSLPPDNSISTGAAAFGRSSGSIREPLPRPVFAICLTFRSSMTANPVVLGRWSWLPYGPHPSCGGWPFGLQPGQSEFCLLPVLSTLLAGTDGPVVSADTNHAPAMVDTVTF